MATAAAPPNGKGPACPQRDTNNHSSRPAWPHRALLAHLLDIARAPCHRLGLHDTLPVVPDSTPNLLHQLLPARLPGAPKQRHSAAEGTCRTLLAAVVGVHGICQAVEGGGQLGKHQAEGGGEVSALSIFVDELPILQQRLKCCQPVAASIHMWHEMVQQVEVCPQDAAVACKHEHVQLHFGLAKHTQYNMAGPPVRQDLVACALGVCLPMVCTAT
jgi:hypothetical protein